MTCSAAAPRPSRARPPSRCSRRCGPDGPLELGDQQLGVQGADQLPQRLGARADDLRGARAVDLSGQAIEQPPDLLRSEEHTSELQSPVHHVCRLLLDNTDRVDLVDGELHTGDLGWAEEGQAAAFLMVRRPLGPTLFPYTTLFRSADQLPQRLGARADDLRGARVVDLSGQAIEQQPDLL